MVKISFIFGTRPEAIKLCPLILAARAQGCFETHVCVTGQHREMLDPVLEVFGVVPDADLALMRSNQSLASLTSRAVEACDAYLREVQPQLVLVQGDTTTAFCAALAAFYQRTPVGHVEAGLRTGKKHAPFPEEMNRVLATRLADYHFAPTEQARENLLREAIPAQTIFVTGNTVIDALQLAAERIRREPPEIAGLPGCWNQGGPRRMVLVTAHRRENFGPRLESMCRGIAALARRFRRVDFVYPVHLNPQVREPVYRLLAGRENIHLLEPLDYLQFVALMDQSYLILTDSGGVQEEAPSLGKPVLVTRDTTERPEAVAMGTVRLVGCNAEAIQAGVAQLLEDRKAYEAMARAVNPYGDGRACTRIMAILEKALVKQRASTRYALSRTAARVGSSGSSRKRESTLDPRLSWDVLSHPGSVFAQRD